MLGVATLICVVGVMTGFQKSLQAKILSGQAHVLIQQFQGSIKDYRGVDLVPGATEAGFGDREDLLGDPGGLDVDG